MPVHSGPGVWICSLNGVLMSRCSNIKPTWMLALPTPLIAGLVPVFCSLFSSCASFSPKDGILVCSIQCGGAGGGDLVPAGRSDNERRRESRESILDNNVN